MCLIKMIDKYQMLNRTFLQHVSFEDYLKVKIIT